jgi:pectinesterase
MPRALLIALFLTASAHAADVHVRVDPAVTTGINGTTEFPTIVNAIDHHPFATPNPDGSPGRVFIEIVPGVYHERVIVTQNHANITLIGLGKSPSDVVITNSLNASQAGGTFFTETVEINAPGFEADNITFENSAGNTGQAVAVANRGDRSIFKHCRFLGYQDTLFADFSRQYYIDSYIEGAVDFIFGNATAVFEHDEIHVLAPGYVTAQSRTSPTQPTGYVILNSRITSSIAPCPPTEDCKMRHTFFLGRPWRPYSRVVVLATELPASLDPAGWSVWNAKDPTPPLAYYAEYRNTGPGAASDPATGAAGDSATAASTTARVPLRVDWSHQLSPAEVAQYLPKTFLAGPPSGPDHWDPIAEAAKLP